MEVEWPETYKILKQKYDEASKAIELGKNGELQENNDVALINYKLVISLVDDALATPVALPDDLEEVDDTWRMGLQIVQNLKRMRAEVLRRISILAPSSPESEGAKSMPLKQTPKLLNRPRTFSELAQALQNLEYDANDEGNLPSVLELLFSCEGVKLYYIASTGDVTTTDESSTLRIIRLDQDLTQNLDATFFMQIIRSSAAETIQSDSEDNKEIENVIDMEDEISTPSMKKLRANTPPKSRDNSLIYPLVPGVSPCFRTEFGAFIFPDLQSEIQGTAFGIVIPSPADEIVLEILESLLHGVVRQEESEEFLEVLEEGEEAEEALSERRRSRRNASERISDNIVQGTCMISNGLVKGTEQVCKLVSYTTPYVISKLNKAPEERPVPPKVTGGIEIAKTATSAAVGITGFVANKVGNATMALGKFLAPHVHAQGSKVLSKTMGYSNEEAQDKMGGVLTVAAGAVEGFGTIYDGLDKSARILGRNLSDNSVKIIEHKYGNSAANVATDTFDTVGNMINLSKSIKIITPQGLAKKAVKGTGKAVITDFRPQIPKTNYVLAGSLYPDLTEFSKKLAESKSM